MCYTSHVVKKEKEEEDLQIFGADTHLKSWSAPTKSMRADGGELSDQLLHLPHTALAPTTFIILFYCWRPLSFFFPPFPSLLSSLAGRIKFNCIVYDRYEVRFGTNSRQTVHRHFMVSFHLSCWCVVVTHLTKTIQDGGLGGGGLRVCLLRQTQLRMNWDKTFTQTNFQFSATLNRTFFHAIQHLIQSHSWTSMIGWI